jgi:hypothetical protein
MLWAVVPVNPKTARGEKLDTYELRGAVRLILQIGRDVLHLILSYMCYPCSQERQP